MKYNLFSFRRLQHADVPNLLAYLHSFSDQTLSRFAPHDFTQAAIEQFYHPYEPHFGYIANEMNQENIVAYFIIRKGVLIHDISRLQSYGLELNDSSDFSFAPSVADAYQNRGIGTPFLQFIIRDVKSIGAKRLILWGGVQNNNHQAIRFYTKNGFEVLGQFEYNGWNTDMMLHM